MIFVTVGAQMPFDRLILAVDAWAGAHSEVDFFAQIGDRATVPRHMPSVPRLNSHEFVARVRSADLIVAHAGMGSILTALEHARPILVLPRRGDLRETRNDHQVATARRFADAARVRFALDERELSLRLDEFSVNPVQWGAAATIGNSASSQLIRAIGAIVRGEFVEEPRIMAIPPVSESPQ